MCKSKMSVQVSQPQPQSHPESTSTPRRARTRPSLSTLSSDPSSSSTTSSTILPPNYLSTTTTSSSSPSLSSLRRSLPNKPLIYDFSELRSATNNFLSKPHSSSSPSSSSTSWRCSLRGRDVLIFQRKLRRHLSPSCVRHLLLHLSRIHLTSIVELLGASLSSSTADSNRHIYLVYEFVPGASLSDCLRNPNKNLSNFTVLSTWMSRMQIATDVAHGLDYIHNNTGLNMVLVHNHIKSSSVLVTEPSFNAKICHFGTAQLCGEVDENSYLDTSSSSTPPPPASSSSSSSTIVGEERDKKRSTSGERSRRMQFEGARGYMSPEYLVTGVATQKSDIYAFGVVLLELLSGEEPFKYKYDRASGDFVRTSIVETARGVVAAGEGHGGVEGRLRMWVDRRLSDSFPVEVGEKMVKLALECVESDPDKRPDMSRVVGKISKLYIQSKSWSDSVRPPTSLISVSLAPR